MNLDELIDSLRPPGTMSEEDAIALFGGELLDPDEADPNSLYGVRRWWGPLVIDEVGQAGKTALEYPELIALAHLKADPSWKCAVSVPEELIAAAQRGFVPGLTLPLYGYLVRPRSRFWGRNIDLPTLRVSRHPKGEPFPAGYQYPVTADSEHERTRITTPGMAMEQSAVTRRSGNNR
jgi:hypothetical protein